MMAKAHAADSSLSVFVGPEGTALFPTLSNYASKAYGRDTLYSAVLGRLVSVDANGDLHPELLERIESSKDFRTWTLTLRSDLTFHNGRKVTARDLEYSLTRYLLSSRPSPGKMMRAHIDTVKITGPSSVEVRLKRADPYFDRMIAGSRDSLVPEEEIAEDHFCWKRHPIGAGPYRISKVEVNGNRVTAERFDGYYSALHDKSPREIHFTNVKGSSVDIVMGEKANPSPEKLTPKILNLPATVNGIFFNYNSDLGRNENFRRAVALTLSRATLIEGMEGASETTDIVPSNLPGRLQAPEARDLKMARDIFGKLLGRDQELIVPIPGVDLEAPEQRWMQRLREQFSTAGVKLSLIPSTKPIFDISDTVSPFFLVGFIPDVGDPFTVYRVFREGGPWVSKLPARDTIFESLLDTDIGGLNASACAELLTKIGARFHEQNYALPLFEQKLLYWIDNARVSDLGDTAQRHIMKFETIRLR